MKTLIGKRIKKHIYHYNYEKYWKMRDYVYNGMIQQNRMKAIYYHIQIRRMEAFNQASIGLYLQGGGTKFDSHPKLPHGLNGIVINDKSVIGKNCTIFHRVTIAESKGEAPTIGDNCLIGANSTIIGGIKIGKNVKIGAGCVVSEDIPDDVTVVMNHPRMIYHQ